MELKTGHVEKTNDRDYEVEERYIREPTAQMYEVWILIEAIGGIAPWKQRPRNCRLKPRDISTRFVVSLPDSHEIALLRFGCC